MAGCGERVEAVAVDQRLPLAEKAHGLIFAGDAQADRPDLLAGAAGECDDEFVVALDRGTGKEVWAVSLGIARENQAMSFLRQRQPLIDGDRLYAFSTPGHLVCLDVDQGKELW